MAKYILVGANPNSSSSHHGGVLTLSAGLITRAQKAGHIVDIIDTLRPGFDAPPLRDRIKAGLRRAAALYRALRAGGCDGVIIVSSAGMSFYERILLSAICRRFGVNDLFLMVDGWFMENLRGAFFRRICTRMLLKIPSRIAAAGALWQELFEELGVEPRRIVRIHFWLPDSFVVAEHPREAARDKPLQFVFVGWMIREKGVYEMLAAIEELRTRHAFSFAFVGGGTLLEHVRQKIRESGWTQTVSAPGWVPQEDFEQRFEAADVFVLPSYAEGFPMSLIEAFSKGLPAICSDVGGISDSLRNGVNGYLIPPRQIGPLVEAMERYLEAPQIIAEHSRAALDIVRANHDADVNCRIILEALR